jgi:hypothetical protein
MMKNKILAGLSVLILLIAIGCPLSTDQSVALLLDGIAIAANAAVTDAGGYAPFVGAAAELAQFGANELLSQDNAATQLQKILSKAKDLTNQFPDVANADANTKAKILAIESAVDATIRLIQSLMNASATNPQLRAAGARPMPITSKDAAAIVENLQLSGATLKKLGR